MRFIRSVALAVVVLACGGEDRLHNEIERVARSPESLEAQASAQAAASAALAAEAGVERTLPEKQILFGDLQIHTTCSPDAFTPALPIMDGEGARTPADACNIVRDCAELDFYSHNDHADASVPEHWAATRKAVRRCNASAGDPLSQDPFVDTEYPSSHRDVLYHARVVVTDFRQSTALRCRGERMKCRTC